MLCHRHVHQVAVLQVNLCNAACPLHHDGIIARGKAVESGVDFGAEIYPLTSHLQPLTSFSPVVVGILVADGLAVQHHL